LLIQQGSGSGMAMASPTMGLRAPLFLTIWVVMMFPAAAPMILTLHRVHEGKRRRGEAFVSTWCFVAGYMLVWTLAGVAAYLAALVAVPFHPVLPLGSVGWSWLPRGCISLHP
jgi:predicted metal-binding membrane protein